MLSQRDEIANTLSKLFYYTDEQNWEGLKSEVFDDTVHMDMTSMGAPAAANQTAQEICDAWTAGFADLDAVHHQAGTYIIDIDGSTANTKAHAIAQHYKKDAQNGGTRSFVGTYDLNLIKKENGWRINGFKFNLKYMDGNIELN